MPVARAGIVFLAGLVVGAVLLLALGLVYQASTLNPFGLWLVALVVSLAALAAAIAWRSRSIDRRILGPPSDQPRAEGTRTTDTGSPAIETATKVVLIDDELPLLRRPPPERDDVVTLKRRFDEALRTGDLTAASQYLDTIEHHGIEADWVAIKRSLLRARQARR
jgi:hypothetical protein